MAGASLLTSCHDLPTGVMDEKELSSLLADMQVAEAYYLVEGLPGQSRAGMTNEDSVRKVIRQDILRRHSVSQKEFDATLDWYGNHLDRYDQVLELTRERLEQKSREYASAATQGNTPAEQTQGLWPSSMSIRMSGNTGREEVSFLLKGSDIPPGSRLMWKFNTTALTAPMQAVMAVDYTDGSSGAATRHITSEGAQQLILQTDSTLTPAIVYGYLHTEQKSTLLLDSISLTSEQATPASYYQIYRQKYLKKENPKPQAPVKEKP